MKWSDSIFWGLICGFLFLLNVYSFYQKSNIEGKLATTKAAISENQERIQGFVANTINREIFQYKSEGKQINEKLNLRLGVEHEEEYVLGKLLSEKKSVIVDLAGISCIKCRERGYDQVVELIKGISEELGSSRVLVLARYRNSDDLDLFKRLNDLQVKIFNKGDGQLGLPAEEEGIPYLFAVDQDLKARYVFFPDEELPLLRQRYLKMLMAKLTR